jgi:hypothetical protein
MEYDVSGAKMGRRLLPTSSEGGIRSGFKNVILY